MATEREGNEIAEALRGLFGLVRGELTALKGELAMVREQVARQNERVLILEERNQVLGNEVNELRYALDVVGERSVATAAVVEERETALATLTEELNKVKAELTAVKGGLAEHKDVITEQLDMAERRRELELRELGEEVRKGEDEMRAELAREREERRREVQALDWPCAMEELTACRNWQNFELEMCRSDDRQIDAWKRIRSALRGIHLNLADLHSLSDTILRHASTMTHLMSIDLSSTSGFSAEGIKHLYRLPRLEKLNLNCTDVSDSALEGIGSSGSLKQLYLHRTKVTNAGLAHLTALPPLEVLWLTECKGVTNAGMVDLGRLTGLESLALGGTEVSNDGLQQLTALTKLTTLWTPLWGCLQNDAARRWICKVAENRRGNGGGVREEMSQAAAQ